MLDNAFVQAQRSRLLARLTSYQTEMNEESLPPPMRAHKAHMFNHIIPEVIHRIDQGLYGICVHCEEMIPQARLVLVPAVMRCVDCQRLLEEVSS
ncbi:TraR/DksA C4-type zinc finger protein [Candidatus Uhrbacteria bacterium]|nr:TraR/DksA C4-type zinc finger protein [Candidatus Uhrbacteria bacterium]